MVYVLTIFVTFNGVTTKFDLDPRLTKWGAARRSANCCAKTWETLTTWSRSVVIGRRILRSVGALNMTLETARSTAASVSSRWSSHVWGFH